MWTDQTWIWSDGLYSTLLIWCYRTYSYEKTFQKKTDHRPLVCPNRCRNCNNVLADWKCIWFNSSLTRVRKRTMYSRYIIPSTSYKTLRSGWRVNDHFVDMLIHVDWNKQQSLVWGGPGARSWKHYYSDTTALLASSWCAVSFWSTAFMFEKPCDSNHYGYFIEENHGIVKGKNRKELGMVDWNYKQIFGVDCR